MTLVKANDLVISDRHQAERIFGQLLLENDSRTKLSYLRTNHFVIRSELRQLAFQSTLNLSILMELILQIHVRQSGNRQDGRNEYYFEN